MDDGIVVGDFNGDGKLDLVTSNNGDGTISLLLGNGDGTFQNAVSISTVNPPNGLVAADFNGDGKLDLATFSSFSNDIEVFFGNNNGTFQTPAVYINATYLIPAGLAAGDFNGDGHPDLVESVNNGNGVGVLLNKGDGTFQSALITNTDILNCTGVAVGDFNGDGNLDVAVGGAFGNSIDLLQGQGNGGFSSSTLYNAGPNPGELAVGHFTNSGFLDLAVADQGTSAVTVLLGEPAPSDTFVVSAPTTTSAGAPFSYTVTALTPLGATDTVYTGTVRFTSSDGQAVLPGDYTFTTGSGNDNGVHTFSATLKTTGTQSVTATDTATASITGTRSGITVNPAAASQLVIHTQPSATATAGQAFANQPVIYEEDAFGNLETGDNSTQVLASLHSGTGPLQGTTTVIVSGGVATFTNLADNKAQTISLDFTSGSLTKVTSNNITVSSATASQLVIQTQPSATAMAGQAFATQPVIYEEDSFGNLETGDSSTQVTASLHSGAGPLQGTTTVTVSGGVATFTNLADNKAETISLDFTSGSLTKATSNTIVISAAATSSFVVTGFPSPITAGVAGAFTVTAQDAFGNATPAYLGTVSFMSSDAQASLPANYTFISGDAGAHSFSATLKTAGTQSLTATDTVTSSITGSQSGITVNAAASDDGLFVSGTYHDLLGRAADTQGLANNLAPVDAARFALLPSFANRFLTSQEYYTDQVNAYYQKYLGRPADPGGLAGNVAALQGGAADEQVIAGLVGSGEYFTKNGGANLSFLQAAYPDILNRMLDSSGQSTFMAQLQNGVSRTTVALELLTSTEYRTNLVSGYYTTFLGRTGSSGEVGGWVNALANGVKDEQVIDAFVGSVEYFHGATLGGDTNVNWFTSLYQKLLNRAPDSGGLNANVDGLLADYAAQRQTVIFNITNSTEFLTNKVNGFYQKYLGRGADPGALTSDIAALRAGTTTDELLIANLVGSPEYLANHGSTNLSFLQAAYPDILGRMLDSSGQSTFMAQLQNGVSRTTVALELLTSNEYRTNLVGGFYTTYLGRTGSSTDIAGWVSVLANGVTDEAVVTAFLTTGEYFLRTHVYP
jgi:hypothetical protein